MTSPRAIARASVFLFLAPFLASRLPAEPEQERAALGAVSYRIHCQSCHGSRGVGDGPMAGMLKTSPADLTRLAEHNGGEFPSERVFRAIDGRDEVSGHGNREMPVWGIGFQDPGRAADQQGAVRARILDLVAYLETLQAAGGEPKGDGR